MGAEFPGGDVNIWSGYGDIVYNSDTYSGKGELLSISAIAETQDLRANAVTFGLSGIPSSYVSTAFNENYQGRPITSWFGVLDDNGALVSDPYQIFSGRMDVMEIEDNGRTAEIRINAESDMIDLRESRERRYTPEDQKIDYPSDEGLDFVPKIQDVELTWGAGL